MGFLNIGKKDKDGKQSRIEHKGKYLRASRTGGVSLRAQTRAVGLNLTANSQHGLRVSRSVGKNTQVAMQNGRFVLRGRYGQGPTKLNLSKTGATVSTRNRLGTFNWVKPKRSSAKLFGVQVRGKNAMVAHLLFALFSLTFAIVQMALVVIWNLVRWLLMLLGLAAQWLWRGLIRIAGYVIAAPSIWAQYKRNQQSRKLSKALASVPAAEKMEMASWSQPQTVAAVVLLFTAWGRGQAVGANQTLLVERLSAAHENELLQSSTSHLNEVADSLMRSLPDPTHPIEPFDILVRVACLAEEMAKKTPTDALPELVFNLDDLMLLQGQKTRVQEEMIEVFSDFAGLMLVSESEKT